MNLKFLQVKFTMEQIGQGYPFRTVCLPFVNFRYQPESREFFIF
jgi:hypothetical protein